MLHAQKAALSNTLRTRLVALREQELTYYTRNCRLLGDQAALVAGFASSGIWYHQFMEQEEGWYLTPTETAMEILFLVCLTFAFGAGMLTVLLATLVALFGPHLALRGPDGSLHSAVDGMRSWTRVVLLWFLGSVLSLQLSALSFLYGHNRLGSADRFVLVSINLAVLAAVLHYGHRTLLKFRVPRQESVSGAFFVPGEGGGARGEWARMQSHLFRDDGLARRRSGCWATRFASDEGQPLTAEGLDAALEAEAADAAGGSSDGGRDGDEDEPPRGAADGIPSHLFAAPPLCRPQGLRRLLLGGTSPSRQQRVGSLRTA